jgi:hypothetical protein
MQLLHVLSASVLLGLTGLQSSCSDKQGIKCFCGEVAEYRPGATTEGLLYVCPNGHSTRSNQYIR